MANFQPQLSAEQLGRQQAYNRELKRSNRLAGELNRTLAERGVAQAVERSASKLDQTAKGLKLGADYWRRSFSSAAQVEEQAALKRSEQQYRLHQDRLRQVATENRAQVQGAEQASASLQRGGERLFAKWSGELSRMIEQVGSSTSHQKTNWAQTGETAGSAAGGMISGPWGALAGGILGRKLGQAFDQGNQSGDLGLKMDRLGEAFARLNERAVEFERSLAFSTMSTAQKADKYKELQGRQTELDGGYQERRSAQEAELARLKDRLLGNTNRASRDRIENKIDQLEAEMRSDAAGYQTERQAVAEELQTYYEDLKLFAQDQKQKFGQARESQRAYFAQMSLDQQGPEALRGQVERLQASLGRLGSVPTTLEEQATYYEKATALEQRKLELTQAYIDQTQALIGQYQGLIDQVAQKAEGLAREDWTSQDYLGELQRLEQDKQRLHPASTRYDQDLLQLQEDQFAVLGQLEAAQREEVDQSKRILESLESSQQSVADKLLEMQVGALPVREAFEQRSANYQSRLDGALNAEGDQKTAAVGEYLAGFDSYLDEARRLFKSGHQFQEIYGQLTGDLQRLMGSLDSERGQITDSLNDSVDMKQLYQDFLASVQGSQQGIQGRLDQFIAQVSGGFRRDPLADLAGVIPHRAEGGLVSGPSSGFLSMLHGTEAVIPLKNGPVPLVIKGPQGDSARMEALLAELIDVVRARGDDKLVVLDTQGMRQEVVRQVSEDSRMGRLRLGAQ